MFNRKTSIPNLLGAALALTGCGGAEVSSSASLEAFCMRLNTCDPTQTIDPWHYNYDGCLALVTEVDFRSQFLSEDCNAFDASYFNCMAALSCDVLRRFNDPKLMSDELDACLEQTEEESVFALACYSMLP